MTTPDSLLRSRAEAMAAEYRAEFLRTGDVRFAWGIADCEREIELLTEAKDGKRPEND